MTNNKQDKLVWDNDKKGIKINEYVIVPLLNQIRTMIADYDNHVSKNFDNMTEHQRDIYAYNSKYAIKLKTSTVVCR